VCSTKKEMINIKGMSEQKCEKIYEAANKIESMGYQTGLQIFEKRKKIKKITTGSRCFDTLLCNCSLTHARRRRSGESVHH
jgi:RecA/RadA recombinase